MDSIFDFEIAGIGDYRRHDTEIEAFDQLDVFIRSMNFAKGRASEREREREKDLGKRSSTSVVVATSTPWEKEKSKKETLEFD